MSQRPLILGLDPGLSATGFAVIDANAPKGKPLALGDVKTKPSDPLGKRLQTIHDGIAEIVAEFPPIAVSVEALFTRVNVKTVLLMAQARGVAILAATSPGADLAEYSPAQIKKLITGSGRASKAQVDALLRAMVPLEGVECSDHATDALAAALCHFRHREFEQAAGKGVANAPPKRHSRRDQWTRVMQERGATPESTS